MKSGEISSISLPSSIMAVENGVVTFGSPLRPLAYAQPIASKGHENVHLISSDGFMVGMNACIFASASKLCHDLLRSVGPFAADEVYYISTELTKSELETFVVFSCGGTIKGYERETDLVSSANLQQLFSSFGICLPDLKFSTSDELIGCKLEVRLLCEASKAATFLEQGNFDLLEPPLDNFEMDCPEGELNDDKDLRKCSVSLVKLEMLDNNCDLVENMPLNIGKQVSPRKRKSKAKTYKESDGEDDDWCDSQAKQPKQRKKAKTKDSKEKESNGEAVAKRSKDKSNKHGVKKNIGRPRKRTDEECEKRNKYEWPKEIQNNISKLFYFPQDEAMRNYTVKFQCNQCVLGFQKQTYLDQHMKRHEANPMPDKFVCGLCEGRIAFRTEPEHRNHMRTEHSNYFLLCPHCTRRFKPHEHSLLADHIAEHNRGTDPSTCYSCGKYYISKLTMKAHLKFHGRFHDGKCRLCPDFEETKSWKVMLKHFNDVHNGEIQYKCGFCPEWFQTKSQVRCHVAALCKGEKNEAHLKNKVKKICEICGTNVAAPLMDIHIKNNHGPDSLKCDRCPKSFRSDKQLKQHIFSVHEEVQCDLCGFVGKGSTMYTHKLKKHTPNHLRPYQCKLCGKGFVMKHYYEQHLNVHTGAKPFLCPHCGQGFASGGTLRGHIRGVHLGIKRKT